jgi:hypothetical protein
MSADDHLVAVEGPVVVVVPARVARLLAGPLAGVLRQARDRGERLDPQVLAVVDAFGWAGRQWSAARVAAGIGTGSGTSVDSSAEHRPTLAEMTTTSAADALGCTERNVRALVGRKVLAGRRVAGSWLLDPGSVAAYARRRSAS